ncbi:MAG TPA: hypothetical protein VFE22_15600 [Edaphobacter sp.]|jgi:hypothetical protein|nr:hypothetical protein [Edaphobacter sp.]
MLRIRRAFRLEKPLNRSSNFPAQRWAEHFSKQKLRSAIHVMGPTLTALLFAGIGSGVAHAQGTMDLSGAQTLMSTFKTFNAFLRRADEGTLSRLLVVSSILLASARSNPTTVLRDAFRREQIKEFICVD